MDSRIVLSPVLLNLAGGDCVEDIKKPEADDGFREVLKQTEIHSLKRKVRRALLRRRRKEKTRAVPFPSSIFRHPGKFHIYIERKKPGQAKKAGDKDVKSHIEGAARLKMVDPQCFHNVTAISGVFSEIFEKILLLAPPISTSFFRQWI